MQQNKIIFSPKIAHLEFLFSEFRISKRTFRISKFLFGNIPYCLISAALYMGVGVKYEPLWDLQNL